MSQTEALTWFDKPDRTVITPGGEEWYYTLGSATAHLLIVFRGAEAVGWSAQLDPNSKPTLARISRTEYNERIRLLSDLKIGLGENTSYYFVHGCAMVGQDSSWVRRLIGYPDTSWVDTENTGRLFWRYHRGHTTATFAFESGELVQEGTTTFLGK